MGGRAAGEIASRIAVCTVLEHFDPPRKSGNFPGSGEALKGISEGANARACAIQIANRAIYSFYRARVVQGVILLFRARPDDGAEGLSCAGLVVHSYSLSRLT